MSENSEDLASMDIVRDFSDLPIHYIFQEPPISVGIHFCRLIDEVCTEWVACLGDDDMWGRYHLEEAARCLAKYPRASAYIAQDAIVHSDARVINAGHHRSLLLAYTAAKRESFADCWLLEQHEVAVSCLAATPLNTWALVGRKLAVAEAFKAFGEPGLGHDSDRYMLWLLAKQTPIVVGREVGLFYRRHTENAGAQMLRENYEYHQQIAEQYTLQMIVEAKRCGVPLQESWCDALQQMPWNIRVQYWAEAIPGAKRAIQRSWGPAVSALFPGMDSALKHVARDWVPPAVYRSASRLYRSWVQAAESNSH